MSNRSRNSDKTITMGLVSKKALSPLEFVNLSEKERSGIKSTRIIPPIIGKKRLSLGKIEVTYETPRYAM
jgi:hypothetical protein